MFIKFFGLISGRIVDFVEFVLWSDLKIGLCSGCLLERNYEGKLCVFDFINKSLVEKLYDKYFWFVNVWFGVFVKFVFVRIRWCLCLMVKWVINSFDSELLLLGYNCCDGKWYLVERLFSFVNLVFFLF